MNTLKKISSIVLLVFLTTSCDDLVDKITGETCEVLIEELYDEYDEQVDAVLNNENLTEEQKDEAIAEYEEQRDEAIQEVQDNCEEELDIF